MKIEMLKNAAGPTGVLLRGGVYEVPDTLAENLVDVDSARLTEKRINASMQPSNEQAK